MASQEFGRVLATTIADYTMGAEDNVIRNRKILALLKAKGRLAFNEFGISINWGVRWNRHDDGDTIPFARSNNYRRAELPWRGYVMSDLITVKEKLMNRGKAALIKYTSEIVEQMTDDFTDRFPKQIYIDGDAAGNSKLMHGFDSFTIASQQSGNFVATPNDTYAGIVTNLANYGGSWTGTWPLGLGDPSYDFWAPIIVDYTNTAWSAATKTWPNTCHEALRFGIIASKRNDSKKGRLDCIFLDRELYRQWETLLDTKERVMVQPGSATADPTLRNLGWGDVQDFEGTEITWEFGVPVDTAGIAQGYGFNIDEMQILSLEDRLFVSGGPYFDEASQADRYVIRNWSNMKYNPRYFAKWAKYS